MASNNDYEKRTVAAFDRVARQFSVSHPSVLTFSVEQCSPGCQRTSPASESCCPLCQTSYISHQAIR